MHNAEGGAGKSILGDFFPAEFAVDTPLIYRNGPVSQLDDLLHVGGNHQHSHACIFQLLDDAVHVASCRRIDATGRLIQNDHLGFGGQRPGDDHLLLVAAGETADFILLGDNLGAEIVDVFLRNFLLAAAGMGVAMGNAAPEAKAAARLVTDTNQEDGVARTLLRLLEEGA